jgi:hypothetical protein
LLHTHAISFLQAPNILKIFINYYKPFYK